MISRIFSHLPLKVASVLNAALLLGSLAYPSQAADLEVGTGKTYSTIQAAIDAASTTPSTDRIVVFGGTYTLTDTLNWNKPVEIVEAPNETATVVLNIPFVTGDINIYGNPGPMVWDGIDIQIAQYETTQGIIWLQGPDCTIDFRNFSVTDPGGSGLNVGFIFTIDGSSTVTLQNVTINNLDTPVFAAVHVRTAPAAHIKAIDCNFQGRINNAYAALLMNTTAGNSRFDLIGCTVKSPTAFGNGTLVQHSAGTMSFTDCHFIQSGGATGGSFGTRNAYWSVLGATSCTLERTTFDTRSGGQSAVLLRGNPSCSMNVLNCAFTDSVLPGPVGGTPNIIQSEPGVGTLNLNVTHSTFAHVDQTSPTIRAIQLATDASFPQTVTLDNNLFYLPTSTQGAVHLSTIDPPASTITVNAGKNLRFTGSADPSPNDQLGGNIVTGDPFLLGDFIHIQPFSSAAGAGLDLGVAMDIDGDSRPNPVGNGPDLGADEVLDGAPITRATQWAVYQ